MKIIVTGGAGFIGYHLCRSLLQRQEVQSVVIVDSLHDYYDPAVKAARIERLSRDKKLRFYKQDILEQDGMHRLFQLHRPDAVIHLAAIPGVRGSLRQPLTYVDVDVKGTVQMLELARQFAVSKFIFASSSSVYGEKQAMRPFREAEVDLQVASPYAASKLAAEIFCRTYAQLYGLAVTSLRFFTVYGPEQRPDMAISRFLRQLLGGEPLTLYDVNSIRDYTYVDDIVAGIEAALELMQGWQVYNLGSGKPVTLPELVQALEQIAGKPAQISISGAQIGDVSATWADISAAREKLGWQPTVTLEEGLRRFYHWWLAG